MKLVELQLFLEVIKVIIHWDFEVRKFLWQKSCDGCVTFDSRLFFVLDFEWGKSGQILSHKTKKLNYIKFGIFSREHPTKRWDLFVQISILTMWSKIWPKYHPFEFCYEKVPSITCHTFVTKNVSISGYCYFESKSQVFVSLKMNHIIW